METPTSFCFYLFSLLSVAYAQFGGEYKATMRNIRVEPAFQKLYSRHFVKGSIFNFPILTFRDNPVFMRFCCQTMT